MKVNRRKAKMAKSKSHFCLKKIIDFFDFDKVTLTKVTGDFFEKDYYAPRPPFEVIVNEKIHNMGIKVMRNWEDALKSYLSEILKRRNAK